MTVVRITLLSLFCAAIATAGCNATREPTDCHSASECHSGSRCANGTCRAAARPVAALSPMREVATYALATLDGSASHDPDGGAIVSHHWSVAPVDAACPAPVVASTDPFARVRFGCAGDYQVSLVVRNDLGFESDTVTTTVRAVSSAGAATISTGPDLSTQHVCAGSPLRCTPVDEVTLAATSSNPVLALRWSVQPPAGRPLSDARRVHFDPDATATAPRVTIETDGVAISGDWVFRVEAHDEYGAVGSAITRVSVNNRRPVITIAKPSAPFSHRFDAERAMLTAHGAVDYQVADPDGDPIQVDSIARHVGDGGARFDLKLTNRQVGALVVPVASFTVEVPYAIRTDALKLVGGIGLERSIELVARDVNGEEARDAAEITIGNRPPVPSSAPTSMSVPHRFDAATQQYLASADFGEWYDPDGDPIFPDAGAPPCSVGLDPFDGTVRASCAVPYVGVPAVEQLVGRRRVLVRVLDPWGQASATVEYTVDIQNSAPVLTFVNDPAERTAWFNCSQDLAGSVWLEGTTITTTPTVVDPDEDPVTLRASLQPSGDATPREQTCLGGTCTPFRFYEPGHTVSYGSVGNVWGYNSLVVSDGAAAPSWEVSPTVVRRCTP